jgi:membrane protease YdiL (CAAX protease family)
VKSLGLLALVAGVLAVTAATSPWVAMALGPAFSFGRVYDRVFEVLLVVALAATWRRLDLGNAGAIGLRDPAGWRHLGRGLVVGIAGITVALAVCWLLGPLVPSLRYPPAKTVRKVFLGLGAALAIGLGEEVLFRGVLLRRMQRDLGNVAAVVGVTAVYAAVHAIRTGRTPGPVHAWSGMERTGALFAPLADPAHLPQLVGLALFGLLLAAARLRTGSLWVPIGIHASWVAVFRVGRLFFDIRSSPAWLVGTGWPPLVGGAAGWAAVAVSALVLLRRHARR